MLRVTFVVVLTALAALPLRAKELVQNDWRAGDVSGSTSSAAAPWSAFDSQSGGLVLLSTGVKVRQGVPGTWAQSDDGAGETGFLRAGASFSSTSVSGTGSDAFVALSTAEAINTRTSVLPDERGGVSAVFHPGSGRSYLFGGVLSDGTAASSILRYDARTDSLSDTSAVIFSSRAEMAAAYHPALGRMFLFGGAGGGAYFSQILDYHPGTNASTTRFNTLPTARSGASAVYHPGKNKIYVFGGRDASHPYCDDILEFDPMSGDSLVAKSTALPSGRSGASAVYYPPDGLIYLFGGVGGSGELSQIVAYDPVSDSRTVMGAALPAPRRGLAGVYHPGVRKILLFGGVSTSPYSEVLEYDVMTDSVAARPVSLPSPRAGSAAVFDEAATQVYLFGASTGTPAHFPQILEYASLSSGTFLSSVFDTGNLSSLDTLSFSPVSQPSPRLELSFGFRAGNVPTPDDSWTNHASFTFVTNGGTLIPFTGNRYVQYQASFATPDPSTSPALQSVAIAWAQTPASATLVSTAFDSGFDSDILRRLGWQGTFPAGTTAAFQLRTSSDTGSGMPAAWSEWLGPTCATDTYTNAGGSQAINALHADGLNDRWFQYRFVLRSSGTFNAAHIGTVTVVYDFLPAAPSMTSLTADSTVQVTASWTDGSTNEDLFVLSLGNISGPAGVDFSTPTADKPGAGASRSYVIGGLSPNLPYFARARAYVLPHVDLYSVFSNEVNVFTLANPPVAPAIAAVHPSSLTLNWGANFNPANTPYEVSMSTDAFLLDFSTPVPFASNLTSASTSLLDLVPGTTYYLRVRAQNGNVVPTAFSAVVATATPPSALSGLSALALGVSSISWNWDSSGPASRYRVYNATDSALLADTDQTSFTRVGLSTNSAASLRVQPYTSSRAGAFSANVQAYTHAAVPVSLRAVSVTSASAALAWDSGGNPFPTPYEVSLSTDGFSTHYSTPAPFTLFNPAAVLGGLSAGTTYSIRVRARDFDLAATGFSALVTTPTLPGPLPAPAGAAIGVSSIAWTWPASAGPAVDRYQVTRASDSSLLAWTTSPMLVETGLSSNSAYGIRVRAYDSSGAGALSPPSTAYSLAAAPAATTISAVHVSSADLAWEGSGNPSWTSYEVHHATAGGDFALLLTVASTRCVPTSLLGGTTHFFRVRALNGDGLASPFDLQVDTYVYGNPPIPPSGLTAVPAAGGRAQLDWTISPTTTVVRYSIYSDLGSGVIDYGVLFASASGSATRYLTEVLTAGTTYLFGLRARDETGHEETNRSVVAAVLAVPSPRPLSAIVRSPPSGSKLSGDRITLSAELTSGSAQDVSRILFQYRLSGTAAWTDVAAAEARHPNPAPSPPFSTHWDADALPAGFYDLRAVARSSSGTDDDAPPWFSVSVTPPSAADIEERRLGAGRLLKRVRVYSGAPASVVMTDALTDVVTRVSFSSGTVSASPTYLRLESAPPGAPPVPLSFADPSIVREISLESGQTLLGGGRTASIVFSYLDSNGDNRVDGTEVRVDNLAVVPYDAAAGAWRREFPAEVTTADGWSVTGRTPHLSFFAALSPASPDLAAVRVYPVPYKPRGTNPDEGKPWSAGDPTSGVVFDNLTQQSMVKVYTVTGTLVWQSGPQNSGGLIRWDANNGDGKEVASGVYFAVVSNPGEKSVVRKVVILR